MANISATNIENKQARALSRADFLKLAAYGIGFLFAVSCGLNPTETPVNPNIIPAESSDPIDWLTVLKENNLLSPGELSEIENISSSKYNAIGSVGSDQIKIVEMSPFKYNDESLNSPYNAVLVVVPPGDYELTFPEVTPGSWLIHTFTFTDDINFVEKRNLVDAFLQAYMNTAGQRNDCGNVQCFDTAIFEYSPQVLPNQP